jgi:hypothetical protein
MKKCSATAGYALCKSTFSPFSKATEAISLRSPFFWRPPMRVDVYRNLNRRDAVWYSIRFKGRVQSYARYVLLQECTFKHATEKQLKAVRTGARQVCQWIKGDLCQPPSSIQLAAGHRFEPYVEWRDMKCDPKTTDGFRDAITGDQIDSAAWARLWENGRTQYSTGTKRLTNGDHQ